MARITGKSDPIFLLTHPRRRDQNVMSDEVKTKSQMPASRGYFGTSARHAVHPTRTIVPKIHVL